MSDDDVAPHQVGVACILELMSANLRNGASECRRLVSDANLITGESTLTIVIIDTKRDPAEDPPEEMPAGTTVN